MLLLMICAMSGCKKTYHYISAKLLTIDGQELRGPANPQLDGIVTLSEAKVTDGVQVSFEYFGTTYRGVIKDNYVLWEKEPMIVSGSSGGYTNIYEMKDGQISLQFYCRYKDTWVVACQNYK